MELTFTIGFIIVTTGLNTFGNIAVSSGYRSLAWALWFLNGVLLSTVATAAYDKLFG